jgi:hypothetical protein
MLTDRRSFLAGVVAVAACQDSRASGSTGGAIHRPEEFGAKGDGVTDDTQALQRCLRSAPEGATVQLRSGAVYRINTKDRSTSDGFGGLKLKSRQVLRLNGAELKALPSSEGRGSVVHAFAVSGWRIEGPGRITGERSSHIGTGGEWGMGVSAWSSHDWVVGPGVEINDCWGDGLYVGSGQGRGPCENFLIDRVHVWNCRRNGISIVGGRNGEIRSANIHDVDGTAPYGGIDLEPDGPHVPNRNIRIIGGKIRRVGVGVYVTVANENVEITGMDIEGRNSGIIIGDSARNVKIRSNPRIKSTIGGAEGAAIRAVGNPAMIRGIDISKNSLLGGGYFVVDFWGDGYRDLSVTSNEIRATNPGVQGIARVHYGTFANNVCVIEQPAGKNRDYFVHLQGASYGGNSYRNLSSKTMTAAHRGGRKLGSDRYESASLTGAFERCDDCDRIAGFR